jgi:hypothetical protein
LTCTDQPGDQLIGTISDGPDGAPGTADDIASWQLGRDVTELVRGSRWVAAAAPPSPPAKPEPRASADAERKQVAPTRSTEIRPAAATKANLKQDSDGVKLDQFGIPIQGNRKRDEVKLDQFGIPIPSSRK